MAIFFQGLFRDKPSFFTIWHLSSGHLARRRVRNLICNCHDPIDFWTNSPLGETPFWISRPQLHQRATVQLKFYRKEYLMGRKQRNDLISTQGWARSFFYIQSPRWELGTKRDVLIRVTKTELRVQLVPGYQMKYRRSKDQQGWIIFFLWQGVAFQVIIDDAFIASIR